MPCHYLCCLCFPSCYLFEFTPTAVVTKASLWLKECMFDLSPVPLAVVTKVSLWPKDCMLISVPLCSGHQGFIVAQGLHIDLSPVPLASLWADLHAVGMLWFLLKTPILPTPFYCVLLFIYVFMAFSTIFHSINFPNNSLLSHSVLPVLFLPYWSFQLYISV